RRRTCGRSGPMEHRAVRQRRAGLPEALPQAGSVRPAAYERRSVLMKARQGGFSLIEVLVTIVILMIGLLGLAALQTNATVAEMEAYQRSQALVLVQDMADRIASNKLNADTYIQ